MRARAFIGLGCALLCGCVPPRPTLEGWIAGCTQVESGPTCVVSSPKAPQPVTIFIAKAKLPATLTLAGHTLSATITHTPMGIEFEVRPTRLGALKVLASNGRFTARIADTERAAPEAVRSSTQGRADLRAGDWQSAVRSLDAAATAHAERGAWSRAVSDMLTAAYALLYVGHQPHEARRRLDRAEPWLEHDRDGWALYPYYRGLHAVRAADPSAAVAPLKEARRRLTGRGKTALAAGVDEVLAVVLQQLGRAKDSELVLKRLRGVTAGGPCVRARRLNNAAWTSLLAAEAAVQAPSLAAQATLEQAVTLYDTPQCRARPGRRTAQLHLAMSSVLGGRFEQAQAILRLIPVDDGRLDARLWRLELEARAELGLGHPRVARLRLQEALTRLPNGELPDAEWRLQLWRARALQTEGMLDEALEAYARADALLDEGTLRIPFGEGRAPFALARRRGTMEWAELLLAQGDAKTAACVVRRGRSRSIARAAQQARLQSLEPRARAVWEAQIGALRRLRSESEQAAQSAWGLAAEELEAFKAGQANRQAAAAAHLSKALTVVEAQAPAWSCDPSPARVKGEVTLVFTIGSHGPLGFAIAGARTLAHRYEAEPSAGQWLAPFDDVLSSATRVLLVVEPSPSFARPHAWPWRGRALNAQRPVAFALDLPGLHTTSTARADVALVVADPERNLAGARAEAAAVTDSLSEAGWQVEHLQGSMAVPQAVRDGLKRASLLHFSGHGRRTKGATWGDRLGLHRGSLSSQDILSAEGVPGSVVLTGCQTASESGRGEIERVGLAQAFLLSGAQQVLGATSDVADEIATEVGMGVHAEPQPGSLDLVQSFHRVAARLDARGDGDWAAFRVWVP